MFSLVRECQSVPHGDCVIVHTAAVCEAPGLLIPSNNCYCHSFEIQSFWWVCGGVTLLVSSPIYPVTGDGVYVCLSLFIDILW